jgi:hypothetical protein
MMTMGGSNMRIDAHVHFVGDGSDGSGCWINLRNPARWLYGAAMVRALGLPLSSLRGGLDRLYRDRLLELVRGSSLDRVVLLAQDEPHDDAGRRIDGFATFFVPNHHVIRLAREHHEFIPAASIHPARRDALDELERCLAAGVRVLKLLPNCLNINCNDARHRPFWRMMASGGMILLAHTGGESSLPVINRAYQDPATLRLPLECGVTVIAAHGAGRNAFIDRHYTPILIEMMRRYPHLYADNSALVSLNRFGTLRDLLAGEVQPRVVYGSDYPIPIVPAGPWLGGLLSKRDWRELRRLPNPFERDIQTKCRLGFTNDTFTRLAGLLGLRAGSGLP